MDNHIMSETAGISTIRACHCRSEIIKLPFFYMYHNIYMTLYSDFWYIQAHEHHLSIKWVNSGFVRCQPSICSKWDDNPYLCSANHTVYIENINMSHQSLSSSSMTAPFFLFLGGTTLKSSCIRKNDGENSKIYIISISPKSIYDAIMTKNHRILKFLWFPNLSS